MKLRNSAIFLHNPAYLWLWITLLVWWSGLAGRDFYLIPALIFIGICSYHIFKKKELIISTKWITSTSGQRWIIFIFFLHVVLFLVITILKYYSFRWNVWDVGNYSNKLYNISQGRFYSSYLGSHNWADHFTPSMSPLAILYLWIPSTHWVTLAKTIAFLSVPPLIFQICRESFQEKEQAWIVTFILGAAWMLFYAPALNSYYYEFQPSALAPPFILYAFLCFQRKQWFVFWIVMIVLLGFKEHLGAVWIGFGCYMVLTTPFKKTGFFLIVAGIIAIYLIMFQVMPFFRNYEASWSMVIGPFQDIQAKLIYLFKILIPFAFLPVIHWRFGIMAGPAIGVNLISANTGMYSTSYHYDDMSATLLILTMILILSSKNNMFEPWKKKKDRQWLIVVWGVCILSLLPSSPMRELYAAIPKQSHWDYRNELLKFDQFSQGESIAVQTALGAHFNRTGIMAVTDDINGNCAPMRHDLKVKKPKYLVFANKLNHYLINDLEQCLKSMNLSNDFEKLTEYQHLQIYKLIHSKK